MRDRARIRRRTWAADPAAGASPWLRARNVTIAPIRRRDLFVPGPAAGGRGVTVQSRGPRTPSSARLATHVPRDGGGAHGSNIGISWGRAACDRSAGRTPSGAVDWRVHRRRAHAPPRKSFRRSRPACGAFAPRIRAAAVCRPVAYLERRAPGRVAGRRLLSGASARVRAKRPRGGGGAEQRRCDRGVPPFRRPNRGALRAGHRVAMVRTRRSDTARPAQPHA
jgi:hypothetical protein